MNDWRADFFDDNIVQTIYPHLTADEKADFDADRPYLEAWFNVFSDSSQPDSLQYDVFWDFWDTLSEYGYDIQDFDWDAWREQYA